MAVNPATEALYIANPLAHGGLSGLFSTHPPIPVRIEKLRERDLRAGIVW
jgi:heat shock protein HtpX